MKMTRRAPGIMLSAIVASGPLVAYPMGGQTYSVEDLGALVNLGGRDDSGPYTINKSGAVAGANATSGSYQAVLYTGSWSNLGTLGGSESLASGMDNSGRVVGYSATSNGTTNAFLWIAGSTGGVASNPQMHSLGTLSGPVSEAYSINDSGQITGYSDVSANPINHQHAFLYSAGSMTDLGQQFNGLVNSYGYGINAAGHVAGTAYDTSYSTPHAFFFNGSAMEDLGLFGGLGSSALAINNFDNIAGYLTTTSSVDHAFIYKGGAMTDMGTLGGHYSYGLAINNSNVVAGGSFTDAQDSIYHAFLWSNGAMLDLNGQLDQTGAGWTLVEARGINDAGQITGIGTFGGTSHFFRLKPNTTTSQAPQITSIQASGSDIVIRFETVATRHYALQTNGTAFSVNWGNLVTNIAGTGSTVSITNKAATASAFRFYRIVLLP